MDFQEIYDNAVRTAEEQISKDEILNNPNAMLGAGTAFVTISYKKNPKFYNWAKKNDLLKRDGYYGAILDTHTFPLTMNGKPVGTIVEEAYNQHFARALNEQVDCGAFNHTYLT